MRERIKYAQEMYRAEMIKQIDPLIEAKVKYMSRLLPKYLVTDGEVKPVYCTESQEILKQFDRQIGWAMDMVFDRMTQTYPELLWGSRVTGLNLMKHAK